MPHVTASPPNAIVFIFDPTNSRLVVPEYVDGRLVAATNECISVGTQSDVDGPTEIHLEAGVAKNDCLSEACKGRILAPSGTVAVFTAAYERLLEVKVDPGVVEIQIFVDDSRNPGRIFIYVSAVP